MKRIGKADRFIRLSHTPVEITGPDIETKLEKTNETYWTNFCHECPGHQACKNYEI